MLLYLVGFAPRQRALCGRTAFTVNTEEATFHIRLGDILLAGISNWTCKSDRTLNVFTNFFLGLRPTLGVNAAAIS